jgi:hypothetical protein
MVRSMIVSRIILLYLSILSLSSLFQTIFIQIIIIFFLITLANLELIHA